MCKCVNANCGKRFKLNDGLNPFYCSLRCADENNKPTTGPAVIDDGNAHLREAHNRIRKQQPRTSKGRERMLRGAWRG